MDARDGESVAPLAKTLLSLKQAMADILVETLIV